MTGLCVGPFQKVLETVSKSQGKINLAISIKLKSVAQTVFVFTSKHSNKAITKTSKLIVIHGRMTVKKPLKFFDFHN